MCKQTPRGTQSHNQNYCLNMSSPSLSPATLSVVQLEQLGSHHCVFITAFLVATVQVVLPISVSTISHQRNTANHTTQRHMNAPIKLITRPSAPHCTTAAQTRQLLTDFV